MSFSINGVQPDNCNSIQADPPIITVEAHNDQVILEIQDADSVTRVALGPDSASRLDDALHRAAAGDGDD